VDGQTINLMLHAVRIGLALNDAAGDGAVAPFYCLKGCVELLAGEFPHSLHQLLQPAKLLIERLHDMIGHGYCSAMQWGQATRPCGRCW
jgi:hypothetical protein